LVPISSTSTPGTAAMASACSMPWGVSSIMMSIVSLLTIALDSDRGYGRKPSWAMGPPSERWPIGGYLQLSTSVRA
jgi:hypothetical protein